MQVPAERYAPSSRPYRVLGELDYPLQDWTATVTPPPPSNGQRKRGDNYPGTGGRNKLSPM